MRRSRTRGSRDPPDSPPSSRGRSASSGRTRRAQQGNGNPVPDQGDSPPGSARGRPVSRRGSRRAAPVNPPEVAGGVVNPGPGRGQSVPRAGTRRQMANWAARSGQRNEPSPPIEDLVYAGVPGQIPARARGRRQSPCAQPAPVPPPRAEVAGPSRLMNVAQAVPQPNVPGPCVPANNRTNREPKGVPIENIYSRGKNGYTFRGNARLVHDKGYVFDPKFGLVVDPGLPFQTFDDVEAFFAHIVEPVHVDGEGKLKVKLRGITTEWVIALESFFNHFDQLYLRYPNARIHKRQYDPLWRTEIPYVTRVGKFVVRDNLPNVELVPVVELLPEENVELLDRVEVNLDHGPVPSDDESDEENSDQDESENDQSGPSIYSEDEESPGGTPRPPPPYQFARVRANTPGSQHSESDTPERQVYLQPVKVVAQGEPAQDMPDDGHGMEEAVPGPQGQLPQHIPEEGEGLEVALPEPRAAAARRRSKRRIRRHIGRPEFAREYIKKRPPTKWGVMPNTTRGQNIMLQKAMAVALELEMKTFFGPGSDPEQRVAYNNAKLYIIAKADEHWGIMVSTMLKHFEEFSCLYLHDYMLSNLERIAAGEGINKYLTYHPGKNAMKLHKQPFSYESVVFRSVPTFEMYNHLHAKINGHADFQSVTGTGNGRIFRCSLCTRYDGWAKSQGTVHFQGHVYDVVIENQCPICARGHKEKRNLNNHLAKHHQEIGA